MALDFFNTRAGRSLVEGTLPQISDSLKRIADRMDSNPLPLAEPLTPEIGLQGSLTSTRNPKAVYAALKHVQESYPEVSQVLYTQTGKWIYMNEDGESDHIRLDGDFDLEPLETALSSIVAFPACFALTPTSQPWTK